MNNKLKYQSTRAQVIKYHTFIIKLQLKTISSQIINQVNNLTSQIQNKITIDVISQGEVEASPVTSSLSCQNSTQI